MEIVDEWAGHYYDPAENSDKIWGSCWTDTGEFLAVWGRRGNRKYQSQTKKLGIPAAARIEFFKMVRQKESKGYRRIPFENTACGNIPSFRRLQIATREPGTGKITGSNLLEQMRNLDDRIRRQFDPDTMLIEFNQLKALTGLLLEYAQPLKPRQKFEQTGEEPEPETSEAEIPPADLERALESLTRTIWQALLE